jgi:WD40 repeat protein
VNEERLRRLLRDAPVPDESGAEERGLRVVKAALAEREPSARPHAPRTRLLLAIALGLVLVSLLLTPAGATVRDWIDDTLTVGDERPAPALTRLPSGGRLLVESASGPWVVSADGYKRRLGPYDEATWSPSGLYVGVARGRQLSAVEPDGDVHWSLSRGRRVSAVRWAPSGYRIAYLSGNDLRVVAGDGTEDRLVERDVSPVAPAWQPDLNPLETETDHVLAYVDGDGTVRVVNTDTARPLSRARIPGEVTGLDWSDDGTRLLVAGRTAVRILDPIALPPRKLQRGAGPATAKVRATLASPPGATVAEAAFAPRGGSFALIRALPPGASGLDRGELVLVSPHGAELRERRLLILSGRLTDLAWSPDGKRLLAAWPDANEWLFIPRSGGKGEAVGNVAREFNPGGETGAPAFPRVAGWCCPP